MISDFMISDFMISDHLHTLTQHFQHMPFEPSSTFGEFTLRMARAGDMHALSQVCLQTGDAGSDATHLYVDDPEALARVYVQPYVHYSLGDNATTIALVAEDSIGVCGYALSAPDSIDFYRRYQHEWAAELQRKFSDPEPSRSEQWTPAEKMHHVYHHPECFIPPGAESNYLAHLHIDLLPRCQGRGLGQAMMNKLLQAIARTGAKGVHLGMHPDNARAKGFYHKLGFRELHRSADTLYLALQF
jgi:ribosomal protein S18 acetylase RimI-like enzyme